MPILFTHSIGYGCFGADDLLSQSLADYFHFICGHDYLSAARSSIILPPLAHSHHYICAAFRLRACYIIMSASWGGDGGYASREAYS